jgi:hypothetical protein
VISIIEFRTVAAVRSCHSTAQGWAFHAAKDEKMAQWLADARERREQIAALKRGDP